jgi:DNA-binding XRE family transcriptional regulator
MSNIICRLKSTNYRRFDFWRKNTIILLILYNLSIMELLIKIWSNIKNLRKNKKISQVKLSELSWLDRSYISNIEVGKVNPSILILEKISIWLWVDIKELF